MATAELAVAMPAVVLAIGLVIGAGRAVAAQVGCIDGARAGARAAARGDDEGVVRALAAQGAGPGAEVRVGYADLTTVAVSRRLRLLPFAPPTWVRCEAVAPAERRDRGSASLLVLAVVLMATLGAWAVITVGSAAVARHRAESAADLAALAGADVLLGRAAGEPCRAADRVARRARAALVGCLVGPATVTVEVEVRPAGPVARVGPARARSRAGPILNAVSGRPVETAHD